MSLKVLSTSIGLLQTVNPDYTLANGLGPAYECPISSTFAALFSVREAADIGNILLHAIV